MCHVFLGLEFNFSRFNPTVATEFYVLTINKIISEIIRYYKTIVTTEVCW